MRSLNILAVALMALSAACASESASEEIDPTSEDDVEAQQGAWDVESVDHEGESTHLWIVNRAVSILSQHRDDAVATRAVAMMNDATCRTNWQQGLFDADFKAEYNNGRSDLQAHPSDAAVAISGATWESHFYDPDTGKNYKGATSPTAFTEATAHVNNAFDNNLAAKRARGCYELGLSLHYYTDLTQPMHAANFTALDRPAKLHSNLEHYSLELQDRFPLADWSGKPTGSINDFVIQTARDAKPLFEAGVVAIVNAYNSYRGWHILTCRNIEASAWRFIERQHLDYKYCWAGNPGVDAMVGNTLKQAQDHTAKYIYLVTSKLAPAPGATTTTTTTPPAAASGSGE